MGTLPFDLGSGTLWQVNMVDPAAARPIGRYLLFGEIASGAKATVHLGRLDGPAGFARTVAIKGLREPYAKDPEFVAMFLDEARLAARIHHPNVVPTLDVVQAEDGVFLVMEYVHGESLARLMEAMRSTKRASDVRLAATIMSGVLHGLHAAHEAKDEQGGPLGIVHRDVSPQNILVGVDGVSRVLDFGVAKAVARLQKSGQAQVKGKIAYMAPERVQNQPATRQSDVYAAAVVTWELLTGQSLFPSNQAAILTAVMQDPIRPPSEVAGHVPPALDRVVLRGLERDPEKRYQTALEMGLELERCAGIAAASEIGDWVASLAPEELSKRATLVAEIESGASGAHPTRIDSAPVPTAVDSRSNTSGVLTATLPPPNQRKPLGRPALLAGIGAAIVLAVLGVVLLFLKGGEGRDAHAAAASSDSVASSASAAPVDTPAAAASSAPSDTAATIERRSPSPRSTGPTAHPSSSPRRSKPSPTAPSACDPPFTIDEHGHKRYKDGCI
jgi:serine/threonine-protein kinase